LSDHLVEKGGADYSCPLCSQVSTAAAVKQTLDEYNRHSEEMREQRQGMNFGSSILASAIMEMLLNGAEGPPSEEDDDAEGDDADPMNPFANFLPRAVLAGPPSVGRPTGPRGAPSLAGGMGPSFAALLGMGMGMGPPPPGPAPHMSSFTALPRPPAGSVVDSVTVSFPTEQLHHLFGPRM
jgi:hypothetical protein